MSLLSWQRGVLYLWKSKDNSNDKWLMKPHYIYNILHPHCRDKCDIHEKEVVTMMMNIWWSNITYPHCRDKGAHDIHAEKKAVYREIKYNTGVGTVNRISVWCHPW